MSATTCRACGGYVGSDVQHVCMATARLLTGEALAVVRTLPEASARCCVTSPPYFGLRDYGEPEQLGLEATPEAYVARLVGILREVRRVLMDDGTLWLNLGDSYAGSGRGVGDTKTDNRRNATSRHLHSRLGTEGAIGREWVKPPDGYKQKDLLGIPWLVAFALRADGWYLRRDIIWQKPNPMPESVTDRPTSAHEYLFLLAKSATYYYDADAIAEPLLSGDTRPPHGAGQATMPGQRAASGTRRKSGNTARKHGDAVDRPGSHLGRPIPWEDTTGTRNARSVWTIATRPYSGAHFAIMPAELARRCIMAGSAPGDTVLDPFGGSGTTAATAVGCGRNAIHIELNPAYQALARDRIGPMFCRGAA